MVIADHVLLTVTHPSEWYDADTIISPFLCQLFTSWTKEESLAIFLQLWRFALAYFVLTCWHKYCNRAAKTDPTRWQSAMRQGNSIIIKGPLGSFNFVNPLRHVAIARLLGKHGKHVPENAPARIHIRFVHRFTRSCVWSYQIEENDKVVTESWCSLLIGRLKIPYFN